MIKRFNAVYLLGFFLILGLTSCKQDAEILEIAGYTHYENEELGFQIQYPEYFTVIDSRYLTSLDEFADIRKTVEAFGLTQELVEASLDGSDVLWYDFDHATDVFCPSATLSYKYVPDFSRRIIRDDKTFEQIVEIIREEAKDQDIVIIDDVVERKTFGNNHFIVLTSTYNMLGYDVFSYQAITSDENNHWITLNFSTMPESFFDSIAAYEEILSTLNFSL